MATLNLNFLRNLRGILIPFGSIKKIRRTRKATSVSGAGLSSHGWSILGGGRGKDGLEGGLLVARFLSINACVRCVGFP